MGYLLRQTHWLLDLADLRCCGRHGRCFSDLGCFKVQPLKYHGLNKQLSKESYEWLRGLSTFFLRERYNGRILVYKPRYVAIISLFDIPDSSHAFHLSPGDPTFWEQTSLLLMKVCYKFLILGYFHQLLHRLANWFPSHIDEILCICPFPA